MINFKGRWASNEREACSPRGLGGAQMYRTIHSYQNLGESPIPQLWIFFVEDDVKFLNTFFTECKVRN